ERLDDCLSLLIHGNRTALPRHQTLRQAITWSYDLLSEPERALFRQLAVFAGGFDLAAAEAITAQDVGGVLARLTSLVDKSLVFPVPAEGPQRFRLLESIRQYAMQRLLDARVAEQARDRHLVWCVQFAELAEPSLIGKDQRVWLDRLDLEHDNFRAALNWAMERGDMTSGLRLAGALARFWQVRGYVTEGRSFLNRLLSGGTTAASADRAKALFAAGLLTHWQSDLLGAEALYRQSLELWREVGDNGRVALLLNQLGILAEEFGDYQQANGLLEESLALRRAIGDEWGIASTLMILGNAANSQADYPRAIRFYEETVSLLRRVGDLRGVSLALGNLGCVANRQGKYRRAVDLNEESLALMREIGERFMMSEPLYNLGVAVAALGDTARAAALFTESLDIQRAHGDRWGSTVSLLLLARVAHAAGDDQRASALAIESLRLRVELGDNRRIPDCLEAIAEFATDLDRLPPATLLFSAAFRMREQLATPLPNSSQASVAAALCRIPALLGASMFADIWQHGQTLSREAAVEEAITLAQALATAERDSTYAHPSPTALGAREREIAALIAAGLTNRQIATQLGISPRTADTHVSHILRKLGLSSRAEIAAALHPTPPH
ncbi:MAG TPA: tetratricopeptide repeat protein, partial [Thermomicrobiales bacterium]|nr:tetratricopeptide repeat protein [Thermomicrobiales bacterium]